MTLQLSLREKVLHSRGGGAVQRCHVIRHSGSYSVAEHSWGVAMLVYYLFPEQFERLAIFALVHDIPEYLVGDVPSTVKSSSSTSMLEDEINTAFGLPRIGSGGLTPYEQEILKACDKLDLYIWAREQQAFGSRWVDHFIVGLESQFTTQPLPWPAHELYIKVLHHGAQPVVKDLLKKIKEASNVEED